jgi:transposase
VFPSGRNLSSWAGLCPGVHESAGQNHSGRCAKGNKFLRSVLCQCAQAAVHTKNSWFQVKFQRLLPRLEYTKAIWAIARPLIELIWKILHDGVEYQERGAVTVRQPVKRRLQRLRRDCRYLGYKIYLMPTGPTAP